MVRAKLDIALWSGLYVIYKPVVSFDLRCQSCIYLGIVSKGLNLYTTDLYTFIIFK